MCHLKVNVSCSFLSFHSLTPYSPHHESEFSYTNVCPILVINVGNGLRTTPTWLEPITKINIHRYIYLYVTPCEAQHTIQPRASQNHMIIPSMYDPPMQTHIHLIEFEFGFTMALLSTTLHKLTYACRV